MISTIDFLTVDENNPNYLITHTPRGGEIKQFSEGGRKLGSETVSFLKTLLSGFMTRKKFRSHGQ